MKVIVKVTPFTVVMVECIQKNNDYENKITLRCVSGKKTVRVLPKLISGNFPVIKSHVIQSFAATITTTAEIEKKNKN